MHNSLTAISRMGYSSLIVFVLCWHWEALCTMSSPFVQVPQEGATAILKIHEQNGDWIKHSTLQGLYSVTWLFAHQHCELTNQTWLPRSKSRMPGSDVQRLPLQPQLLFSFLFQQSCYLLAVSCISSTSFLPWRHLPRKALSQLLLSCSVSINSTQSTSRPTTNAFWGLLTIQTRNTHLISGGLKVACLRR